MKKIIIAAMGKQRTIGKNGEIPWHFPEDLRHFKEKTSGHAVVMGRKTFQSLPSSFKPLPDRENIVLTRSDFSPKNDSVKVASSLEEAWKKAGNEKVFIIGGESIYEQTLSQADKMILTKIDAEYSGDTFFPEYSEENWREVERIDKDELSFVEYQRKR